MSEGVLGYFSPYIYLINATNEHSSFSIILSVLVANASIFNLKGQLSQRKKLNLCRLQN